ncbi:MAG: anaerobic ribonucleoside-triphosphate reductase activating protein [Oscillospiraceae bacterium]|nr:anaerobic ribonucleoside-triphosphate reductase activating protein [Oscillospiraceae bacterium]
MKISGLQKLTLLDFPGRVACTVFLGGCNFRCPFCHNSQLLGGDAEELMDSSALLDFLRKRRGVLDGVCITGGEPTLHADLPELLREIRALGYQIKLDTNGYRPDVLKAVIDEGLVDYVAMDVKNGPAHYGQTIGLDAPELAKIEQSIRLLLEDRVDYELRTTVVSPLHTEASISAMAQWLTALGEGKKVKRMFVQPFVDRDTVAVAGLCAPRADTLSAYVDTLRSCADYVTLRGA